MFVKLFCEHEDKASVIYCGQQLTSALLLFSITLHCTK